LHLTSQVLLFFAQKCKNEYKIENKIENKINKAALNDEEEPIEEEENNDDIENKVVQPETNAGIEGGQLDSIRVTCEPLCYFNDVVKNILTEKISFINIYRDYYLLCGIIKNKSEYNFLGKLIQYEISDEIVPLYENRQHRHNGSIINCIIFKNNEEEEYFISLGTDKKIIVTKSIPDLKLKSKKITNIKNEIYENNKNNNNESRAEKNIEYEENKNINNIYISPIKVIDY